MTLPIENLDDKTFEELVKEAISRIPIYAPEWTDHNIHDPGITLIELFAWLAEMQIYRLNRITDKSYRKFLKLMGIPKLKPSKAAVVDVTFSLHDQQPKLVRAGTKLAARDPISGEDIIFETEEELNVTDAELRAILSRPKSGKFIDNSEANRNENVYYYAFRYKPEVGDEMYLGFNKSLTGGEITLAFYLYEDDLSKIGRYEEVSPSVTLSWEYYTGGDWEDDNNWSSRLEIKDETKHLTVSGKIRFKIEDAMKQTVINEANLFWLRCRIEIDGYEIPPKIDFLLLNTVSAIQSFTLNDYKFSSSGLPDFYLDLEYTPVIEGTLKVKVKEEDAWIEWKNEVEDFDASKPGDRHYSVDLATGRVSFGDGITGKIPPKGEDNIIVSYRSGGGVRGNVKPRVINKVLDKLAEVVTVDNKKAAVGGEGAETLEEAILRARKELKTVYRAVTSADYEHLAMNTPGLKVARAKAIPRYHPGQDIEVPGIVTVIVVPLSPYEKPMPSTNFLKNVYRHLDKHRLLTTELFVIPPRYIEIYVDATVVIKPRYKKEAVEQRVRIELENFLHPITGGIDQKGWPFGRPVYRSELYEVIDGVEGVNYVNSLRLKKKDGECQTDDIDIPAHGIVYSGTHKIKAKEEKEDYLWLTSLNSGH
jgi:hypothetical protein